MGKLVIDRQEFDPTVAGEPRWFSTTKVPMYDRQGRVTGLIGISHNITERMKSEEVLRQVNTQLTERVRQMALLNELEEQLRACVDMDEVYHVTSQFVSRLFPAELGALYVINTSRNWMETAATWGTEQSSHKCLR